MTKNYTNTLTHTHTHSHSPTHSLTIEICNMCNSPYRCRTRAYCNQTHTHTLSLSLSLQTHLTTRTHAHTHTHTLSLQTQQTTRTHTQSKNTPDRCRARAYSSQSSAQRGTRPPNSGGPRTVVLLRAISGICAGYGLSGLTDRQFFLFYIYACTYADYIPGLFFLKCRFIYLGGFEHSGLTDRHCRRVLLRDEQGLDVRCRLVQTKEKYYRQKRPTIYKKRPTI